MAMSRSLGGVVVISAPSITISKPSRLDNSYSLMPSSIDNFSVHILVGTQLIINPSVLILLPNSSIVYFTVEPVPKPTFIPFFTYPAA